MRFRLAVLASLAAGSISATSLAAEWSAPRDAARGSGTEADFLPTPEAYPAREGIELGGYTGAGYGLGLSARLGYAFASGIYAGASFTYFTDHASFVGGELGYKFLAGSPWELRPYVFAGPAFLRQDTEGSGPAHDEMALTVQPGLLGAYHFRRYFLAAEMRTYLTPGAAAFAVLGGAGASL